jgi:hypothetical protein
MAVRLRNEATMTSLLSQAKQDQNPRCPSVLTPMSGAAKHGDVPVRVLVAQGERRTPFLIPAEDR